MSTGFELFLSEFGVGRKEFWFEWDYAAITQTLYLRMERNPDPESNSTSPTGSTHDLESLFQ